MRDIAEYTLEYNQLPFEQIQVRFRRKKILEQLDKYNHLHILEIGCGMEPLFLYKKDFEEMTVVEPSDIFFQNACSLAKDKKNINIIHGFAEKCYENLNEKRYNFIVISGLLHELENPNELLHVIHELCSENTIVHINVPNALSLHRLLALEMNLIHDVHQKSNQQITLSQNFTFDIHSLSNLLTSNGFEICDSGSYFPKYFTHAQMQELYDIKMVTDKVLDGIYQMEKYLPEYGSEIYVNVKSKQ